MSKYTGLNMDCFFDSSSIAAGLRTMEVDPRAAEPDVLDSSARGSTMREEVEGLAGAIRTRITLTGLDESGGSHAILDLSLNDTGAMVCYPEGTGAGKETISMTSARLLAVPRTFNFEELTIWRAEFLALGEPTYGTVGS